MEIRNGQFFICTLNPGSETIWKTTGTYEGIPDLFICEQWGMNEKRWEWTFAPYPNCGGFQIPASRLAQMKHVSAVEARHFCEQRLRKQDDEWRARYAPNRDPLKIVRCTCGVGDHASRTERTIGELSTSND